MTLIIGSMKLGVFCSLSYCYVKKYKLLFEHLIIGQFAHTTSEDIAIINDFVIVSIVSHYKKFILVCVCVS